MPARIIFSRADKKNTECSKSKKKQKKTQQTEEALNMQHPCGSSPAWEKGDTRGTSKISHACDFYSATAVVRSGRR